MENVTSVELTRDCAATQIPIGTETILPSGTAVDITQTLGGSYTVHAPGGLFRIAAKDADALGIRPTSEPEQKAEATGPVSEPAVWDTLRNCYDPEIPVNIYDLGLIYGVDVTTEGHAVVTMTLTTPHCPVAESMPGEVELRVGSVPGVGTAEVNLVWDPPWDPQKMSDDAKLELGML